MCQPWRHPPLRFDLHCYILSHRTATTVANIPRLPLSLPLLSFAVYFNKPWHQHQQHFVLKQTL